MFKNTPFRHTVAQKSLSCILLGALLIVASQASAQSLPTSNKNSVDGKRPQSTDIGFFELLESGSNAFLELFEGESSEPSFEDPRWNSVKSPRHAVMTFVEAMHHVALGREEALARASKAFGKVDVDDSSQIAMDLLHVFDRLPEIASGTIPGPDVVQKYKMTRYELFPRGIDHEWVYRSLSDSPDGHILLVADADGNWHFDQSTLTGVADLLKSLKQIPPRGRLDRKGELFKSILEPTIQRTTVGDWAFFMFCTVTGIFIAWAVGRGLKRIRHWRASGDDDLAVPLVNGVLYPAWILIVTVGVAIGSARLNFHPTLAALRTGFIEAAAVIAIIFLLVSLIEMACLGFRRSFFSNDDPYARMMSMMLRRAIRVISGVVVVIFLLQNVLDWNVTALLGGFAIIALALSLASQDAVKNLFGAFTIFATRPFMTGDWVRFEGQVGSVTEVSLQATKIRLLTGEMYSVPNMKFIDSPVENLSERKYLRRVMEIAITYDTPVEKVREAIQILRDILSSESISGNGQADLEQHPPKVWFDKFGSHYLNLRADYWYMMHTDQGDIQRDTERGWFSYLDHATKVNQQVLERFNAAEIDFAFPTQSLYLANDPDRGLHLSQSTLDAEPVHS